MKKEIKKFELVSILLLSLLLTSCTKKEQLSITYSLYPYLLDKEAYKENIESLWYEKHPDIVLNYVDYNCYVDGKPEGIDVIMYDAILESYFIEEDFIQEIEESQIDEIDDFFNYSINDIKQNGKLYGIPAILCGNFYIYDRNNEVSINADNIYDLEVLSGDILIEIKHGDYSLVSDVNADTKGEYIVGEDLKQNETLLTDLKNLGNSSYYEYSAYELAEFYDQGIGSGYIGYSETLSLLKNRISDTDIKNISYSNNKDIVLLYADVVGLSSEVKDNKKGLCIELMNVISSTETMQKTAVNEGVASYLLFPRKSAYTINDYYYDCLYECISSEDCHIFRYPSNYYKTSD